MARDHHHHACTCGNSWSHMTPPDDASYAEYEAAHRCRQCSKTCYTKYTAEEAARVKANPELAKRPAGLPPALVLALLLEVLTQ